MRVAFLGVIWAGLPLILFPVAQQWIDSSVAGMLNGAVPLAGAAWAVVLLRRPLPRVHAVGLLIGFSGVLAISWPQLQGSRATTLGAGLVVLAVVLYGLAVNLAVPLQQRYGALPVLLRAQLAALVLLLPFGLWGLGGSTFSWPSVLAMVPLGVLGTGVAFVLMTTLVGRVGRPPRGGGHLLHPGGGDRAWRAVPRRAGRPGRPGRHRPGGGRGLADLQAAVTPARPRDCSWTGLPRREGRGAHADRRRPARAGRGRRLTP